MGSLPLDTLCVYCGRRRAGYIPDGCIGPVCFDSSSDEDESEGCYELGIRLGWHVVENMYLVRRWRALIAQLSRVNCIGMMHEFAYLIISRYLYLVDTSSCNSPAQEVDDPIEEVASDEVSNSR